MNQIPRDYNLVGESAKWAEENGLVGVKWYRTKVDRAQLKTLMERKDGPAIRDTLIWFAILILSGAGGVAFWGTIWCVPFFFVYGVFYGSASDSRWHECGHSTAFKTQWMNKAVYHIACFMIIRNPIVWRWGHTRHHADTIIVGRDPEISIMRPVDLLKLALNFVGILDTWHGLREMVRLAFVGLSEEQQTYVPTDEAAKSARQIAWVWCAIYAATGVIAYLIGSILPFMLIGLPRLYGAWHHILTGLLQHGGLAENVPDFRLNTRTVMMNPISRFIYWNMNYHVEHHMYLMVPYHALPQLHELIKHDCPTPNSSMWDGYKQMLPALIRQVKNEHYFIERELPDGAEPYVR